MRVGNSFPRYFPVKSGRLMSEFQFTLFQDIIVLFQESRVSVYLINAFQFLLLIVFSGECAKLVP